MSSIRNMSNLGAAAKAALPFLLLIVAYLYEAWPSRPIMDDAYISMRYAYNLAHGHGMVFNFGERVEGYSNLLWTLFIAAGIRFGAQPLLVVHALSVMSGLCLLFSSWLFARQVLPHEKRAWAFFSPLLLLSSNGFADAYTSGLETTLYAALVTLAVTTSLMRRYGWMLWCLILSTLTRPDGAMVAFLLAAVPVFVAAYHKDWLVTRKLILWPSYYAIFLLSMTMIRWHYYHDVLPNTFYAKVGGIPYLEGFKYLYNCLGDGPFLLLPGVILYGWKRPQTLLIVAFYLVYIVYIGGDILGHGRFLLAIEPLLIGLALSSVFETNNKFLRPVLTLLLLINPVWNLYVLPYPRLAATGGMPYYQPVSDVRFPLSDKRLQAMQHDVFASQRFVVELCRKLKQEHPQVKLFATVGIGIMGYEFGDDVKILDLVGLIDANVSKSSSVWEKDTSLSLFPGHQRTNSNYILDRRPDIIQIPLPRERSQGIVLPCMKDLWNNPRFTRDYLWDDKLGMYRRKNLQWSVL